MSQAIVANSSLNFGFAFDQRVTEEAKNCGPLAALVTRMNSDLTIGEVRSSSTDDIACGAEVLELCRIS